MRLTFSWLLLGGVLLLTTSCTPSPSSFDDSLSETARNSQGSVELIPVTLKGLQEAIDAQKGKIVVVDVWADFCVPCKKAFPHFLELQERYGKEGVVCVSLTVDPPSAHDRALKFLEAQQATIPNYRIDEDEKVWQDHFDIGGPPAARVYDRDGKLVRQFDTEDPDKPYDHTDVENLVKEILASSASGK